MTDKDVARIYREMEIMLIDSMNRNLGLHTAEESLTKLNYPQWQAIKLKELRKYQKENKEIINGKLSSLPDEVANHLREELKQGYEGEISKFRKAIGERRYKSAVANADSFFKINSNKVNALIEELNGSLRAANHAVLRMANDTYRDVITKAGLFVSNGVLTEQQAIDMALKDFLNRGLNCIEYKDGRRVNIADYASMAVRTANQRAYMAGEGEFRKEIGNPLVIISKHNTACELCQPFESKVLIDDVYSGGTQADGDYMLLSEAMKLGLYHPHCRHGLSTYYPELDDINREYGAKYTSDTVTDYGKYNEAHIANMVQKYTRLVHGCSDPENIKKYTAKLREWQSKGGIIEEEPPIVEFVPAKTIEEAEEFAKKNGVKYADYGNLPLETSNALNEAILTLPEDIRPVFVGDSKTLEQYQGYKLPRSSKGFYGVTVETDCIHLGYGKGVDFDTSGQMVGISSSYKKLDKITTAKQTAQSAYQAKHNGNTWFYNVSGSTTPYHEMGHVYANTKGLPDGFEEAAVRWAKESKCDMLKNPSEAWAEAWASYHTKNDLPDYISEYIKDASNQSLNSSKKKELIFFDDDGIISLRKSEFRKSFSSGEVSTYISPQKQARHIKGTKQFEEYVAKLKSTGSNNLPSYIREDLTNEDLENLVVKKLNGNVRVNTDGSFEEFILCDDIIGYYYSPSKNKYIPTRCVKVKYALGKSRNIHIVPVKERVISLYEK